MNYLTELLALYRWMGEHRLTPLLQAYWHLLMYYNNKAAILAEDGHWYWPVTFRVANSVVGQALGLKDRFKINHQRKHLVKHSRIDYTPHTGQEAGDYRLIPFDRSASPRFGYFLTVQPPFPAMSTLTIWASAMTLPPMIT